MRPLGPPFWDGGTCKFAGEVLGYTSLPGTAKVEGGRVLFKGHLDVGFQILCPFDEVAAVFNEDGRQIYHLEPADE